MGRTIGDSAGETIALQDAVTRADETVIGGEGGGGARLLARQWLVSLATEM